MLLKFRFIDVRRLQFTLGNLFSLCLSSLQDIPLSPVVRSDVDHHARIASGHLLRLRDFRFQPLPKAAFIAYHTQTQIVLCIFLISVERTVIKVPTARPLLLPDDAGSRC